MKHALMIGAVLLCGAALLFGGIIAHELGHYINDVRGENEYE